MYLEEVLLELEGKAEKAEHLEAIHLFTLNDAIFNLPESDAIGVALASRLFQTLSKIRQDYNSKRYIDPRNDIFYEYLALLSTMQKQPFFDGAQTEKIFEWVREATKVPSPDAIAHARERHQISGNRQTARSSGDAAEENARLKAELAKFKRLENAVSILQTFACTGAASSAARIIGAAAPAGQGGQVHPVPAPATSTLGKDEDHHTSQKGVEPYPATQSSTGVKLSDSSNQLVEADDEYGENAPRKQWRGGWEGRTVTSGGTGICPPAARTKGNGKMRAARMTDTAGRGSGVEQESPWQ